MITVSNRIPVNPEHAEAFEKRFSERLGLVDKMDGFIAYRLLRPTQEDNPYVVLTFWENEEKFRAWTNSDNFKEQHKKDRTLGPEAFAGPVKLEIHEVVQESGAALLSKA
jgi:heme-degrading monooxygenase HmoA